jgi:predicted transcriptional regulator
MAEPSRAEPLERKRFRPAPEDEDEIRGGLADIEAGRSVTLTEAELAEWETTATGDFPEAVQARVLAVLACPDSSL